MTAGETRPSPEKHVSLAEHLLAFQTVLLSELPNRGRAGDYCGMLNHRWPELSGRKIQIDSGVSYTVSEVGTVYGPPKDPLNTDPNSGIVGAGVFERFDVHTYPDQLAVRGSQVIVHEPCVVYIPDSATARSHAGETDRVFVPIIRLGNIEVVEE